MSVKLYKEILEFLSKQQEVIYSFEFHLKKGENKDVEQFIDSLNYNIKKCKENIERIVDK